MENDITESVNQIIEALLPIYDKAESLGINAIRDFIISLFASLCKLCLEFGMEKSEGRELFDYLWDLASEAEAEINKKDLN